jgi:SAM-dependent methyltransferase
MTTLSLYDEPELYDALLPASPDCIEFYVELARHQNGPVLELACGTGQLTVPIAQLGLPVVGIDLAPAMLRAARERANNAAVAVDLLDGDMRTFSLERRFALIFIARNSLLHLCVTAEIEAVFKRVCDHLLPGGLMAFDIFNPDVGLLARPPNKRFPVMTASTERSGQLTVEATFDYDAATQVNRSTWIISSPNWLEEREVPIHVRSIFPEELPLLLRAGGLRVEERFGDYSRGRFESGSARQVVICRPA